MTRPLNDLYSLFLIEYDERQDKEAWNCLDIKLVTWSLQYYQVQSIAPVLYRYDMISKGDELWTRYWLPGAVVNDCSLPKQQFMIPTCFAQWKKNYFQLLELPKNDFHSHC